MRVEQLKDNSCRGNTDIYVVDTLPLTHRTLRGVELLVEAVTSDMTACRTTIT